ncbi:MAG: SAM-dependent methyltransferase [Firmicutes bacterium]|nr:SAM-dependent methyltransferase [Bacillota bacterium]
MLAAETIAGSFRDPSGFLYERRGVLYRQINRIYQADYERLIGSGLYHRLVEQGWLVPHEEVAVEPADPESAWKVIRPERVPFVSYPYEWCFGQLRDAALLTLQIHRLALEHGMGLKDASAYNVQFRGARPVWIDTLSFAAYREGEPWVAYRQFCQHFLAPLALMAHREVRLSQLLRVFVDGIPLDLASRLLPWRTRLQPSLTAHVHLHARVQQCFGAAPKVRASRRMSRHALLGILSSLERAVAALRWEPGGTVWSDYYQDTNYSPAAFEHKRQLVSEFLQRLRPRLVWDLGANRGVFSRLASERGIYTVAFDMDPSAVEKNYRQAAASGDTQLLPLVADLTNPSGATGWAECERMSLAERGPADALLALALIHHLAIGNNVPLESIAEYFARLGRALILEFVPKEDSQVQRLLATREDIFAHYTRTEFERAFGRWFRIEQAAPIRESQRVLYCMRRAEP